MKKAADKRKKRLSKALDTRQSMRKQRDTKQTTRQPFLCPEVRERTGFERSSRARYCSNKRTFIQW